MILQNNYWFTIVPSQRTNSDKSIAGKWLFFAETAVLQGWLEEFDHLVEIGTFRAAKVARKLPNYDPFPDKPCVLCVFTSAKSAEKEKVKKALKKHFNISVSIWKSNLQTQEDWQTDGWLNIQAQINTLRRDIASGSVADAQSAKRTASELTRKLQSIIGQIDEPERLREISLSAIPEALKEIQESTNKGDEDTSVLVERLGNLEKLLGELSRKSFGVNITVTNGDVNIGGDVVGRDKIKS